MRWVLTTLSVPISTSGGETSLDTICEIKLAVMPITAIRHTACRTRTALKVAPRAPWLGRSIFPF